MRRFAIYKCLDRSAYPCCTYPGMNLRLQKYQLRARAWVNRTTLLRICPRFSKYEFPDLTHGLNSTLRCNSRPLCLSRFQRLALCLCATHRRKFHHSSMCILLFHVLYYLETSLSRLSHYWIIQTLVRFFCYFATPPRIIYRYGTTVFPNQIYAILRQGSLYILKIWIFLWRINPASWGQNTRRVLIWFQRLIWPSFLQSPMLFFLLFWEFCYDFFVLKDFIHPKSHQDQLRSQDLIASKYHRVRH